MPCNAYTSMRLCQICNIKRKYKAGRHLFVSKLQVRSLCWAPPQHTCIVACKTSSILIHEHQVDPA